jgi:DNA-binding NtrC family response regulator
VGRVALSTRRALVVDDDVAIRLLVTRILERRDFVVDTARDGAEGIEKLASQSYSVIVLDLMMPRIDGAGVLKYLGEYHPAQLATVIVMTAFGASAMERLSPQPEHFLEKPFDVDALVREVSECVESAKTGSVDG